MRHFIPNFGLFILAIVLTLSMAFALKCSLPTVLEYECDDAVAYGGDGIVDCCCFSTLCNNDVNLTSKGCAVNTTEAADVADHQCKLANSKFDLPEETIMLCRGDLCNAWYPKENTPAPTPDPKEIDQQVAEGMLGISSSSVTMDTSTMKAVVPSAVNPDDGDNGALPQDNPADGDYGAPAQVNPADGDNGPSPQANPADDAPPQANPADGDNGPSPQVNPADDALPQVNLLAAPANAPDEANHEQENSPEY